MIRHNIGHSIHYILALFSVPKPNIISSWDNIFKIYLVLTITLWTCVNDKKNNNCALSSANAWGSNNRKFHDIIDCVKFILLYQVHSFIFFSLWSILIEFQFSLIHVKFNELERVLIQLTHLSIIVQFLGWTGLLHGYGQPHKSVWVSNSSVGYNSF